MVLQATAGNASLRDLCLHIADRAVLVVADPAPPLTPLPTRAGWHLPGYWQTRTPNVNTAAGGRK